MLGTQSNGAEAAVEGQAQATAEETEVDMTPARSRSDTPEDALRHAEAKGEAFTVLEHPFTMLQYRRVCLESYPYIADAHLDEAVEFLRSKAMDHYVAQDVKTPCAPAPSVKANLLGNFLMAPTDAAEHLLSQATEPMLVFVKGDLPPRTLSVNFPESLGAVFVRRLGSNKILFDKSKHTVFIGGDLGLECRTSPVYNITRESKFALIPQCATHFCYVCETEQFIGGFLYLAQDLTPLAVNAIGFTPTLHALAIKGGELHGKRIGLTPEAIRYLEGSYKQSNLHGHCQKRPVTVGELKKRGGTHYAFVPPDINVGGFDSGPLGGFAYWLKNGETVYFEIEGAGEVLARSVSPWPASVRCAMLPDSADFLDLKSLSKPRRLVRTAAGSALMTVARLRLRDPSHPVVLRGLALATRREVFATVAAKAIAQLAFEHAHAAVGLDIVCRLASIACLIALVYQLRERILDNALIRIMFVLWARDALKAFCLSVGYHKQGWLVDFLSLRPIAEVIYLIVWLTVCVGLVRTDADELPHWMRALIAFLGTMSWMSLLLLLRGFSWARGLGIVSVFQTLRSVWNLVIIMLFFVLAGAHARLSLAPASIPILQTVFSVYRLGFLNNFEAANDIEYATEDGDEAELVPFQYVYFMVASFVVTIAMTNILIGAISRRFDHYQQRSSDSLVKHQARLGLDLALLDQGSSRLRLHAVIRVLLFGLVSHAAPADDVLWCCYREKASLDQGDDVSTSVRRINGAVMDEVMAARKESTERLDDAAKKLDRLIEKVAALEKFDDSAKKLDRLTEQVAALEKKSPRRRRGTSH